MLKFHDNPTVNESEIVIFLRQVWWYAGKERVLEGREEKTKLRGREGVESIVSMKTDLRCLYLSLGYSQPIIYFIFLFIIL